MIVLPHRRKAFRSGGGGAFDPTSITGLQLWLDASDSTTLFDATSGGSLPADGGNVKRWEDKSGNARHYENASTGGTRETAAENELDVVHMTNGFTPAGSAFTTINGATFFLVLKRDSDNGGYAHPIRHNAASNHHPTGGQYLDSFGASARVQWTQAYIGDCHLYGVNISNDASSTWEGRINGVLGTSQAQWSKVATTYQGIGTNGNYCELLIYTPAISTEDREAVESYLMAKWGI